MTIHAIIDYLKYSWKAKSRHGVHSPFAYAFVADIIEDRKKIRAADVAIPWMRPAAHRYDTIVRRMMTYYGLASIASLPLADNSNRAVDVLVMSGKQADEWRQLIEHNWKSISNNTVVVIQDIHANIVCTKAWNEVCKAGFVKMSIDLYGIGLLFFRKEFMVQQGFVLKVK